MAMEHNEITENKSKPTIAAFDFDGTITTKDTLFDFIKHYHGTGRFIVGLCILSPLLVLFKLGVLKNDYAKQKLFSFFFKNQHINTFNSKCESYKARIETIVNHQAIEKIKWHRAQNHQVIIISASVENWISPWAQLLGIEEVLATKMAIANEKITGQFSSPNCHGIEKVNRLLALYPNSSAYELYMYGDSEGDKDMLALAQYPFYRTF